MVMANTVVNVFEYLDYREFLRDHYRCRRETEYGFSHRSFSRRAGLRSSNYLKLVMDGERNLTPEMASQFAGACGLGERESDYFCELVAFNQARDARERDRCHERLRRFREYRNIHKLDDAQTAYHSSWYIPAIRELAALENFSDDPKWIASLLKPKITPGQAQQALDTLLELGLLVRRGDGRIEQSSPLVTTGSGPLGYHIANYHRTMLAQAADALDTVPREEREISSLTLCISQEVLLELKERIREFRREWDYPTVFRAQWRAVELAYLNSQVSMIFVLPNEGELAEFDAAFDEARLSEIVQALGEAPSSSSSMINLHLPRFGFDAGVDLVPRLGALGMTDAFSEAAADFSGMVSENPPYIETALHKSHIAVDEVGTVASAATTEVGVPATVAPSLFFDRPFVFFIYDHTTGTVLFVGRLSDPGGTAIAGDPIVTPTDPERICALLAGCTGRTLTVEACQASFDSDDEGLVDQCADCLQLRDDMCMMDDYCFDGGVSVCDESACAEECPTHEF